MFHTPVWFQSVRTRWPRVLLRLTICCFAQAVAAAGHYPPSSAPMRGHAINTTTIAMSGQYVRSTSPMRRHAINNSVVLAGQYVRSISPMRGHVITRKG